MGRARRERNRSILRLRKLGVRPSTLAAQHSVTCGRITQIVAAGGAIEKRRAALETKYGAQPDVTRLGDDTPFDVLMLFNSATHGWAARIRSLCRGRTPMKTLGDLRHMSDAGLLSRPGIGAGLFAELRALCPHALEPEAVQPVKELIES